MEIPHEPDERRVDIAALVVILPRRRRQSSVVTDFNYAPNPIVPSSISFKSGIAFGRDFIACLSESVSRRARNTSKNCRCALVAVLRDRGVLKMTFKKRVDVITGIATSVYRIEGILKLFSRDQPLVYKRGAQVDRFRTRC